MSNSGDEGHYDETPGGREKGAAAAQTVEQYFKDLLEKYRDEITAMLTAGLTWSRFMNSCLAAMRRDPSFLEGTTTRSVITALIQSAQDGLVPDGKEGVITPYKNKRSGKREAKWNPMTQGLRKRARETDQMIIDAQVVCANDNFVWHQGDDPRIEHEPAKLGTPRGDMIGTYAIFKREDGTILHREIMDKAQVMTVKGQSSQEDSLMWTKFETEAWRKSVIRRGIKTVPVSDALMQVASRDDDAFVFDQAHEAQKPALGLVPPPAPPPAPKLESKPAVTLDASMKKEPVPVVEETRTISQPAKEMGAEDAYADWLRDQYAELEACVSEPAVDDLRDRVAGELKVGDVAAWREACAAKAATVFQ